ncbi:hypothetical protein ACL02S_12775 [Nocardia sp. 004]|uniref:hypothetical protein n=1 Tax=Nocardia sp. 004 TaxID=3385978 RepID=UPI0039A24712
MDPNVVVAAVSTGALSGLTDGAKLAVADAYKLLKAVLTRKYPGVDVAVVETNPESPQRQGVLEAELVEAGVGDDSELCTAAEHVLRVVHEHAPQAAELVGLRLERVSADEFEISQIRGKAATVVDARDVNVRGKFTIRDVQIEGHQPHP